MLQKIILGAAGVGLLVYAIWSGAFLLKSEPMSVLKFWALYGGMQTIWIHGLRFTANGRLLVCVLILLPLLSALVGLCLCRYAFQKEADQHG